MKIVTATKYGGSIVVPLTGIAREGEQYLVQQEGNQIILTPVNDVVKSIGRKK